MVEDFPFYQQRLNPGKQQGLSLAELWSLSAQAVSRKRASPGMQTTIGAAYSNNLAEGLREWRLF